MDEMLRHRQSILGIAENRIRRHIDVVERDPWMVGRHVKGPQVLLNLEPVIPGRNDKAGDALGAAIPTAGPREYEIVRRHVQARVPDLFAVNTPAVALALAARLHPGGVRSVVRFSQSKGDAD